MSERTREGIDYQGRGSEVDLSTDWKRGVWRPRELAQLNDISLGYAVRKKEGRRLPGKGG